MLKHDTLLSGRQDIQEKFRRKTEKKDEDTAVVNDQDEKLEELKTLIAEEQAKFD